MIAQHITILHHRDHMTTFDCLIRFMRNRLVEIRVEQLAFRFDACHAFGFKNGLQFLVNQFNPANPRARIRWTILQSAFEVIQHRQEFLDDVALHHRLHQFLIALNAALIINKVSLCALPAITMFRDFGFGLFESLHQRFDLRVGLLRVFRRPYSLGLSLVNFFFVMLVMFFLSHTSTLVIRILNYQISFLFACNSIVHQTAQ